MEPEYPSLNLTDIVQKERGRRLSALMSLNINGDFDYEKYHVHNHNDHGWRLGAAGRQLSKSYVAPVVYAKCTPLYFVKNDYIVYMPEIYLKFKLKLLCIKRTKPQGLN